MKLNEVKFLPATNAVADAYTKATGMPFVGEMMVAAAGNGEPQENYFSNMTVEQVSGNEYQIRADANGFSEYLIYAYFGETAVECFVEGESGVWYQLGGSYEGNEIEFVDGGKCTIKLVDEATEEVVHTEKLTYTFTEYTPEAIEIFSFGFWKEDDEWKCGAEASHNAVGYDIIVEGSASEFNVKLVVNEEDCCSLLIMDENYENYIGDICEGGNWTAHTSYNGTDFQDQSGTYETPDGCPADCENEWEDREYSSYWDCECNENDHCVDCENDWEAEGFESYEDCDCQVNGNCGEEEPEEEPVEE